MSVSPNPPTPSPKTALLEPLSPNGDNLAFISPELATFMDDLRAKVKARRAWPVAGRFSKDYTPMFTPFQRLPQEVRSRIFELASYEPRVIEVTCHPKPSSVTPVPALLHACSESRKVALKIREPLVLEGVSTGTFVNWDVDTIFVNDQYSAFNPQANHAVLYEKCKKLALIHLTFPVFHLPVEYKAVESLIIVLKVAPGEGNVEFVPVDDEDDRRVAMAMDEVRTELVRLWQTKRIKSYTIRSSIRGRERTMLDPQGKECMRKLREKERKMVEPLRSDEDLAIRLQYDLDHGRL